MSDGALGDLDLHLFNEGRHTRLYDKLGAHRATHGGAEGVRFSVWAPDAERVAVIGDFNGWNGGSTLLAPQGTSGIWAGFAPGAAQGGRYKYRITPRGGGDATEKADPLAFFAETPPATASIVWDLDYGWGDGAWMADRAARNGHGAPVAIYEVHLGSWMRVPEEGNRSLTYRELGPKLAAYVQELGFTHVELLPVMEHPFYGSWGYQVTGFFAASSRYGTPQDLMYLIDVLHQHGIGVILDWVPAHFPRDAHGLGWFDGTHLYEHADPRQGVHPDWDSLIFNYGRNEVRSFLLSAASFWLDRYHADGLRVDGVASMLYLDYSRDEGEWVPNRHGGRENLEAISLLRQLNETLYEQFPGIQMFAEESTDWSMVSRPTYVGGLGFGFKWDMGWMHDTLEYFLKDPVHRRYHHNQLTFRGLYAFHESFVLPLSHDEVAHGKGSLLSKMPGDDWQRFANLRLLLSYMWLLSGKKLLFMGSEFGQWAEWNHDVSLDWHQLEHAPHQGIRQLVRHLNGIYRGEHALHALDCDGRGFTWVDANDADNCVLTFLRRGPEPQQEVLAALNFTPVPRHNYRVGVDRPGTWREILNSDAVEFGGSGNGNFGAVDATPVPAHGRRHSLNLTLPPLAAVCFKPPEE